MPKQEVKRNTARRGADGTPYYRSIAVGSPYLKACIGISTKWRRRAQADVHPRCGKSCTVACKDHVLGLLVQEKDVLLALQMCLADKALSAALGQQVLQVRTLTEVPCVSAACAFLEQMPLPGHARRSRSSVGTADEGSADIRHRPFGRPADTLPDRGDRRQLALRRHMAHPLCRSVSVFRLSRFLCIFPNAPLPTPPDDPNGPRLAVEAARVLARVHAFVLPVAVLPGACCFTRTFARLFRKKTTPCAFAGDTLVLPASALPDVLPGACLRSRTSACSV